MTLREESDARAEEAFGISMKGSSSASRPSKSTDVTLKIPRPLYERLSRVIEGTGFRSVTEFCVYALRDLVAAHDPAPSEETLSPSELDVVRRRLRSLGYLRDPN